MRTKFFLFALLFFICVQNSFAQTTFFKEYFDPNFSDYDQWAIANDIKPAYSDGYIVTGIIGDTTQFFNPYLMKLDIYGDTVWAKHYFGYGHQGNKVFHTCDSGYISIGERGMFKTDSVGNLSWSKLYPDIQCGVITNDCGYILAGTTTSFGAGGEDIYVIKTDTGGNPLWSKTYGGTGDDIVSDIRLTDDGGYIIIGSTNSFSPGGTYIIKADANGDTLWTKTYNAGGSFVEQTYDKGYIILGADSNSEILLLKTDSMGTVLWSKKYGFGDCSFILQTLDSGYIFIATTTEDVYSDSGFALIKTDSNGNPSWGRYFPWTGGWGGVLSGTAIMQANDRGYMLSAQIKERALPGLYIATIFMYKTDVSGHDGCNQKDTIITAGSNTVIASSTATIVTSPNDSVTPDTANARNMIIGLHTDCFNGIEESDTKNTANVYPTLVAPNSSINISFNEDLSGATVMVYNMLGVALYQEVVIGKQNLVLNALKGKLSTGMYFVRIIQGGQMWVQKIVVVM